MPGAQKIGERVRHSCTIEPQNENTQCANTDKAALELNLENENERKRIIYFARTPFHRPIVKTEIFPNMPTARHHGIECEQHGTTTKK